MTKPIYFENILKKKEEKLPRPRSRFNTASFLPRGRSRFFSINRRSRGDTSEDAIIRDRSLSKQLFSMFDRRSRGETLKENFDDENPNLITRLYRRVTMKKDNQSVQTKSTKGSMYLRDDLINSPTTEEEDRKIDEHLLMEAKIVYTNLYESIKIKNKAMRKQQALTARLARLKQQEVKDSRSLSDMNRNGRALLCMIETEDERERNLKNPSLSVRATLAQEKRKILSKIEKETVKHRKTVELIKETEKDLVHIKIVMFQVEDRIAHLEYQKKMMVRLSSGDLPKEEEEEEEEEKEIEFVNFAHLMT